MANRKKVEEFVYKLLKDITGDNRNTDMYKEYFSKMSDEEFGEFIKRVKKGKERLTVTIPNFADMNVSVENNMKIAKRLGISFFHKLQIAEHDGILAHETPTECMVLDLPVRRQSQTWAKKIRVGDGSGISDKLTGQRTKKAASSKMSLVEVQLLVSMGLQDSLLELMKFRGGDKDGRNAMNAMCTKLGYANMETLKHYAGRPEVVHTLNSFLTAMHIRTNI